MQVNNLKITINKDNRVLINNLSFSIKQGDKAVIIGEEGNGKSTIIKALYDQTLVSGYATVEGQIVTNKHIGYLAQELPSSALDKTIYQYFCDETALNDVSGREIASVCTQLRIDNDFFYSDQVVGKLSGGEKVKMQLAKILFQSPDLLLLDEPSNDLDISTLLWLEDFIVDCACPIIYVSHDEALIENTANMIIHIEQIDRKTLPRVTIARLTYSEYVEQRNLNISHQTQVAEKERADFASKMARWREIYQKVETAQRNVSRQEPSTGRLLKKKMKTVKAQQRRYEKEQDTLTGAPKVEVAIKAPFGDYEPLPCGKMLLEYSIPCLTAGDKLLAHNVNLSISGNPHIAIIGRNGVGKSTLIKQIVGELSQKSFVKLAYMPQNYIEQLPLNLTPVEFIAPSGDKADVTTAQTNLACLRFTPQETSHKIEELSGGQKAKLLYLKVISSGYNVIVLDEPTRNFSPLSCPVIRSALSQYMGTIIAISHDRKFISEVCNVVYELTENGLTLV